MHYFIGHNTAGQRANLPIPEGTVEVTQQEREAYSVHTNAGGQSRVYDTDNDGIVDTYVLVGPARMSVWDKETKEELFPQLFVNEHVPEGYTNKPIPDERFYVWSDVADDWVLDPVLFTPVLQEELTYHRRNSVSELVAEIEADTYIKDGDDFVLDEEGVILQMKVDSGTEASLFTKVHVTPNAPSPASHERYKFVNKNVYVTRDTFAKALISIDVTRQPYFDAEGKTMDEHALNPFTSIDAAKTYFDSLV